MGWKRYIFLFFSAAWIFVSPMAIAPYMVNRDYAFLMSMGTGLMITFAGAILSWRMMVLENALVELNAQNETMRNS